MIIKRFFNFVKKRRDGGKTKNSQTLAERFGINRGCRKRVVSAYRK